MIGAWMFYVLLVSSVLSLAALALERALHRAGHPVRWGWAGAIATSVLFPPARALWISRTQADAAEPFSGGAEALAGVFDASRILAAEGGLLSSSALECALLYGWAGASLAFLGVLLLSAAALHRGQRSWRRAEVAGMSVFLTEGTGPAVVGFWRPAIALPAWVLAWEEPLQRVIVAHELEHIRARDPRLLFFGLAALVLAPWNLPLWWQFRRLRLAIELDCDARVLLGAVSPREYGSLLLNVAGIPKRRSLAVAAFATSNAGLAKRIRLLGRPTRRAPRGVAAAIAALALLLPFVVHAIMPAPKLPDVSYLTRIAVPDAGPSGTLKVVRGPAQAGPRGALLPGTPKAADLAAAVQRHHPAALEGGLPPEQALWFITDGDGRVAHTGVGRGSEWEIHAEVQARHPAAVSDQIMYFKHQQPGGDLLRIIWLRPAPEGGA